MTKIASMTPPIPRGTVIGRRVGVQPIDEAEHFFKCEACGGWFDMRDLGAVLDHEEPLPRHHPANRRARRWNESRGGFGTCNGPYGNL